MLGQLYLLKDKTKTKTPTTTLHRNILAFHPGSIFIEDTNIDFPYWNDASTGANRLILQQRNFLSPTHITQSSGGKNGKGWLRISSLELSSFIQ